MTIRHTVAICSYNPDRNLFSKVLSSLQNAFEYAATRIANLQLDFIIIDNNSRPAIITNYSAELPDTVKVVVEKTQGLFFARHRAHLEATTDFITFLDDDNILSEKSLFHIINVLRRNCEPLGILGGRVIGKFADPPPEWFYHTGIRLGCNDLGSGVRRWKTGLSDITGISNTPPGSGVTVSRKMLDSFYKHAENSKLRRRLGRKGGSLSSGEDNDITIFVLRNGYEILYDGRIEVHHIIPKERLTKRYLAKMAYASNRSWVLLQALNWPNTYVYYFKNGVIFFLRGMKSVLSSKGDPLHLISAMRMLGAARGNLDILMNFRKLK